VLAKKPLDESMVSPVAVVVTGQTDRDHGGPLPVERSTGCWPQVTRPDNTVTLVTHGWCLSAKTATHTQHIHTTNLRKLLALAVRSEDNTEEEEPTEN